MNTLFKYVENNKIIRNIELIICSVFFIFSIICFYINKTNIALVSLIILISVLIIMLYSKFFTLYEKTWFIIIIILANIISILFPDNDINGINGILVSFLYLLDTLFNILCELLISKQSRYNFLVSIAVEITEIILCFVLMARFATLAVTLFFWLPIDIVSFINWSKHRDEDEVELTVVRKLTGYQEFLVVAGIAIWTIWVGYFISGLDIQTDFFNGNKTLETIVIYLDACVSALGICNGLFILFRLQEQWIAWILCTVLETVINIISGQYILLVLKAGYFTNSIYGFIKWDKYIKKRSK